MLLLLFVALAVGADWCACPGASSRLGDIVSGSFGFQFGAVVYETSQQSDMHTMLAKQVLPLLGQVKLTTVAGYQGNVTQCVVSGGGSSLQISLWLPIVMAVVTSQGTRVNEVQLNFRARCAQSRRMLLHHETRIAGAVSTPDPTGVVFASSVSICGASTAQILQMCRPDSLTPVSGLFVGTPVPEPTWPRRACTLDEAVLCLALAVWLPAAQSNVVYGGNTAATIADLYSTVVRRVLVFNTTTIHIVDVVRRLGRFAASVATDHPLPGVPEWVIDADLRLVDTDLTDGVGRSCVYASSAVLHECSQLAEYDVGLMFRNISNYSIASTDSNQCVLPTARSCAPRVFPSHRYSPTAGGATVFALLFVGVCVAIGMRFYQPYKKRTLSVLPVNKPPAKKAIAAPTAKKAAPSAVPNPYGSYLSNIYTNKAQ